MLGVGGAKKTYMDDVFSTFLFKANGSTGQTINNSINLSGEGGLVWHKDRTATYNHVLWDTVRGTNSVLSSDTNSGASTVTNGITFNSNGYSVNAATGNESTNDTASWTFRKAPGFFDVVTYTGNGSNRTIAHSLGSIPGMVIVKRTDGSDDWFTYHRELTTPGNRYIRLNNNSGETSDSGGGAWNSTVPTSTTFSIGTDNGVNENGATYVAYLFAGGESTAATARSVDFDGSNDYLTLASSSDFDFGTGDFTIEAWCYNDGGFFTVFDHLMGGDQFIIFNYADGDVRVYSNSGGGHLVSGVNPGNNRWYHLAVVRESGKLKFYIDGVKAGATHNFTLDITQAGIQIGRSANSAYSNGRISNLRIVKGTAVYTSSFRPSTVPLTSISGTVLLCCNDSSVTGKTTGGTITASGSPVASTDSPFDDPAGFVFGDAGDQNVIKTGSYIGTGNGDGPVVDLGWEPQWIMIKRADAVAHWALFDTMRGITHNGNDNYLYPGLTNVEYTALDLLKLTSTGFKLMNSAGIVNGGANTYIYVAIRRSDGYVGKPPSLGTSVFAMDTGNGSSTIPALDSGFPVDFGIKKAPASGMDWVATTRLTGLKYVRTNTTDAEGTSTTFVYDSNVGYAKSQDSNDQGWMWKRHAGFDVVTYTGLGGTLAGYAHSLGKIPEMMWVKRRDGTNPWSVYHKGLNGGSSPEGYGVQLNTSAAEAASSSRWGNTAPTSTHFFTGSNTGTNNADSIYIAMLFASVAGISKVGFYDGSSSTQTIECGFQPRFLIQKRVNGTGEWHVLDTTRGWGSGNDNWLSLESTDAQSSYDFGAPTSSGFTITGSNNSVSNTGGKYIYYAHA